MNHSECDFSGWVTRYNVRCSDKRTILSDAFKHHDGGRVPLVWNHNHDGMENIVGHIDLENRPGEGVYGYGYLNHSQYGQLAKTLVYEGDITGLSIYANQLQQNGNDVLHGNIREVSLVLAGANPGAFIDNVIRHGENIDDEVFIYVGDADFRFVDSENDDDSMEHSDEPTVKEVFDSMTKEQQTVAYVLIAEARRRKDGKDIDFNEEEFQHADSEDEGKTFKEIFDSMTDIQKEVVTYLIGVAAEDGSLNENEEVKHADNFDEGNDNRTIKDVLATFNEEQRTVLALMIANALTDGKALEEGDDEDEADVEHSDTKKGGKTIGEVFDTFTEEQKLVAYELIRQAIESRESTNTEEAEHSAIDEEYEGGESNMSRKNIFEQEGETTEVLSHSEIQTIIKDATRYGSLKESFIQHGVSEDELMHAVSDAAGNSHTYGIADIEYLFPEDRLLNNAPVVINQNTGWVNSVMSGVHHTPFSRIKTVFADITVDDARAKGYVKGNTKVEEVFGLLKRTTSPTTVYKKQKLDRDDIIDITDLDIVAWLKAEMRGKLNEELARAYLFGDQRNAASDDKINEQCIRPIWTDADLFTIKARISLSAAATDDQIAKQFIRACRKSRKDYKGSGNPVLFASEDIITDCLLMEDNVGRVIYDTEEKLATALRVSKIITVPVMENLTRTVTTTTGSETRHLFGIIVNLNDYTVGADKGGAVAMFEDFDIDVNREKYLIETRCSGALTLPYSAIAIEAVFESAEPEDPEET